MRVQFWKMHGLGNDFVVLDARELNEAALVRAAPQLCDRHFGIGADGLLLWTGSAKQPRMTVVNADGSVPEMCGNGLRCFAKWLGDHHLPHAAQIDVATGSGTLECQLQRGDDGLVQTVQVTMGVAEWRPALVPMESDTPLILGNFSDLPQPEGTPLLRWTALSTGNPHLVTFDPLATADRLALGPILSVHPRFPRQINVEFAQVVVTDQGPELHVDVFERGCGWTLACGTGATATVHAAVRLGLVPADREIPLKLPGGWLSITVSAQGLATMRGPANDVFEGTFDLPADRPPMGA